MQILLVINLLLLISILLILAFPIFDYVKKNYMVNKELAEWFKKSEITAEMVFDGKKFHLQKLSDNQDNIQ